MATRRKEEEKRPSKEEEQQHGLNRFSSWVQPRKCPAPRYHRPPLGDECDEEGRGEEGIKDGSTKNVNGGWRSPGPGPD